MTTPATPTPREKASQLVNDYARKQAALKAATAGTQAEITALTAALNQASAPYLLELEKIEAEAKALALENGEEIFVGMRSLTENGFTLALRETAAVQVDDEDAAILMLKRDSTMAMLNHPDEAAHKAVEIACNACLRTTTILDREYIARHYDEAPEWFQQYGISVVDKLSASLKPAPKPRAKKATKIKPADESEQKAAA